MAISAAKQACLDALAGVKQKIDTGVTGGTVR